MSARLSVAIEPGLADAEILLLKAAVVRGPASIDAWKAWESATDVDALDPHSQWVLPLLYSNLHDQGVAERRLLRYRNVYLHNWYKNVLALRRVEPIVSELRQANAPVILLRGAAMAVRYYARLGSRPFDRVRGLLKAHRAATSETATGELQLQASLFGAQIDALMIARAETCPWKSTTWRVLDPAGQLLDICVHEEDWDSRSKLFALVDAAMVIRSAPSVDWARFESLAREVNAEARVASLFRRLDFHLDVRP